MGIVEIGEIGGWGKAAGDVENEVVSKSHGLQLGIREKCIFFFAFLFEWVRLRREYKYHSASRLLPF